MISRIISSHSFFVRESYRYSGVSFASNPFQVTRAYLRFMWFSIKPPFVCTLHTTPLSIIRIGYPSLLPFIVPQH